MDSRSIAATTLATIVRDSRSLDSVLPGKLELLNDKRDRAFAQEICYGVLRWYPKLLSILNQLLDKPLRKKDVDIECLLLSGIYQLDYLRTPGHAAVSATVSAAKTLNKSWACSMVNAVLRRYQREHEKIQQSINTDLNAQYAHPQWIIEQVKTDWPDHWREILQKNNERPPQYLRVNSLKISRRDYLKKLSEKGLNANAPKSFDSGIHITSPVDVERLPGFQEGEVSVQDFGAQLAAKLLNVKAGQNVLDACAAPGGKTAHIYETQPGLEMLVAVEADGGRLALLNDTLQRLGIDAEVIQADTGNTSAWWDNRPFDRILLDVPCSATGVIRRHPDIKLLRKPEQIELFNQNQSRLLESVWPLLKPGGRMLYATCSILSQENDIQIEKFSRLHKDVGIIEINADWGVKTQYGRQTLPPCDETDGFYYALLEKPADDE